VEYEPIEPAVWEPGPPALMAPEPETLAAEAGAVAGDEGPDRDQIALEALEAELAVLEADLARVDGARPADAPRPQPDW